MNDNNHFRKWEIVSKSREIKEIISYCTFLPNTL